MTVLFLAQTGADTAVHKLLHHHLPNTSQKLFVARLLLLCPNVFRLLILVVYLPRKDLWRLTFKLVVRQDG